MRVFTKKVILFFVSTMLLSNYSIVFGVQEQETVVVYAHGLTDNADKFKDTLVRPTFPDYPLYGNNGPEIDPDGTFNKNNVCLGQEEDIKRVIAACETALQNHGSPKIIAFGFSKGSATWLNTLGYLNNSLDPTHKKILSCIKAVIVIAPFADLCESEILTGRLGYFGALAKRFALPDLFGTGRRVTSAMVKQHFPAYDANGIHPIKSIQNIPHDLPLFFAHSVQDELIPIKHSRMMYQKLLEKRTQAKINQNNIYLYEFNGGEHKNFNFNGIVETKVRKAAYDFLTMYGLMPALQKPHSLPDLHSLQPSLSEIETKIFKHSTVPSIGYGILFALGFETCKYVKHACLEKDTSKNYQTSLKHSFLCGALFAVTLELIHQGRTRRA